jgi:hypothetical protein
VAAPNACAILAHMTGKDREQYRTMIDELVRECHHGQGRIGAGWAMRGVWIQAANDRPDDMPEEHRINMLLAGMEQEDREVLARMLASAFEDGVFPAAGHRYQLATRPLSLST